MTSVLVYRWLRFGAHELFAAKVEPSYHKNVYVPLGIQQSCGLWSVAHIC
jgi:hypothetical protein